MNKYLREELALRGCDLIFEYKGNVIGINTAEFTPEKEEVVYQKFGLKTLRDDVGIALYNPDVWKKRIGYSLGLVEDCLAPEQPFFTVAPNLRLGGTKDLRHWDVSGVKSIDEILLDCRFLEEAILDGWDVSSVKSMNYAFWNCNALKRLSLKKWNVCAVKSLNNVFSNCTVLKELILDGWDVSSVESMDRAFYNCVSLSSLSLKGWHIPDSASIDGVFESCPSGISVESLMGSS